MEERHSKKQCHFLNKIRYLEFIKDTKILEMFIFGKWDVGKVQIESFESVKGGAGAKIIRGDPKNRHLGLVSTIKNFMWYGAAFVYGEYVNVFMSLANHIQYSEHLFLRDERLLVNLINKEVGALMRAVSIKNSIEVSGIIYSLEGPHNVVTAMSACGEKFVIMFGEREGTRKKQEIFNEESAGRKAAIAMIQSLSTGAKRNGESEEGEEMELSQRSKKKLA
jgi:hypothetical protein